MEMPSYQTFQISIILIKTVLFGFILYQGICFQPNDFKEAEKRKSPKKSPYLTHSIKPSKGKL
jgi:hypothetical protein